MKAKAERIGKMFLGVPVKLDQGGFLMCLIILHTKRSRMLCK